MGVDDRVPGNPAGRPVRHRGGPAHREEPPWDCWTGCSAAADRTTAVPYAAAAATRRRRTRAGGRDEQLPDEQAVARYRYLLRTAPPEQIEQAHAEAFAQLTPDQRQQVLAQLAAAVPAGERPRTDDPETLARAATRAEMRQPGTLERALGGYGPGYGRATAGGYGRAGTGAAGTAAATAARGWAA